MVCYKVRRRSIAVEWLADILRIGEVPGSNAGPGTAHPKGFRVFPEILHADAETVF
jgi:hypothetical protein